MVQLGRPGSLHPATRQSLERALFTSDTYEPRASANIRTRRRTGPTRRTSGSSCRCRPSPGPGTVRPRVTRGRRGAAAWRSSTSSSAPAGICCPTTRTLGCVLFLETSEEPRRRLRLSRAREHGRTRAATAISRGSLGPAQGLVVRAAERRRRQKARYTEEQREAVLSALAEYHPGADRVRRRLRPHRPAARDPLRR